jgi:hypothetical protein
MLVERITFNPEKNIRNFASITSNRHVLKTFVIYKNRNEKFSILVSTRPEGERSIIIQQRERKIK